MSLTSSDSSRHLDEPAGSFDEPLTVINAWLEAQIDYQRIPAISAGFGVKDRLVWSAGFGLADVEQQIKATDATVYSICSISKLFTSIAIMQLRDQKRLNLDDEISDHLPWFDIEERYPHSGPITIRSLLTHSSGLPRESDFPYWTDPTYPFPTETEMKNRLLEQTMLYRASAFHQYSNLGMALLGNIIAEKSGLPYEQYIFDEILIPLGLESTFTDLIEPKRQQRLASGYGVESRKGKRAPLPLFKMQAITSAAGFASSVPDLIKFGFWQFKALDKVDDPILNGNTLREMHRIHWVDPVEPLTWGLGFRVERWANDIIVGHGGACPGYLTQFILIPKKKWVLTFMVNGLGIDTGQYVRSLYDILHAYDEEKEEAAPEHDSPAVQLEEYCGKYHSVWDGEGIIAAWKGKLAFFNLRSAQQGKPIFTMRHIAEDRFRRIGGDKELKEEVRFERDADGKVSRVWQHSQYNAKI